MPITLNQIAALCGVSRGTVDRALHNKGNVRPELAAQIKEVANAHGYVPNRAGLALSRASRPTRIGVVIHSCHTAFMQLVLESAKGEAKNLALFSNEVLFRQSNLLEPAEQVAIIEDLVEQHQVDGLALMPLNDASVEKKINELTQQRKIPVVTFNTDLSTSRRLCYVGQDNNAAGRTVAELLRLVTGGQGLVSSIICPAQYHAAYSERYDGFARELACNGSQNRLLTTTIESDSDVCAKQATLRLLAEHADLTGIYATTPGYTGVCEAVAEYGAAGRVHVIMHDEITSNLRWVQQGVADFVIGQDAEAQGSLPLHLLSDYLQLRQWPEKEYFHTDIRVLLRHNISSLL